MQVATESKLANESLSLELAARVAKLEARLAALEQRTEDRVTMVVFSGEPALQERPFFRR
jgi:hypothetical protein